MNVTAKSRYGLKLMMDLADHEESGHQQRHSIAERQSIPLDFMDQIVARLKQAGLIDSIRGRSGGVQLKKKATEISLWDILIAVEDSLYPVKCLEHDSTLAHKTLHDVVAKWQKKKKIISQAPQARSCSRS